MAFLSNTLWSTILFSLVVLAIFTMIVSLLVSYYVYDFSDLYQLSFLPVLTRANILHVHARFDEISTILSSKYPTCELSNADFYDPNKHTEVSIRRARKSHLANIPSLSIDSNSLPYSHQTFDLIVIFLAAHEIRNVKEREEFFKELRRVYKPGGAIYVTEHLRDANNFAAYTIGVFHFYARERWHACFQQADLTLTEEIRTTPFMTTFVLSPNGNAY
ncbi:class I SAM-dependent methyltransferase [Sphingobacterium chungjuense]|uniref:class I SAM-dependent methyltransferase n=1 Tax=Sphingobacterium chungjuense TaxID=2675553 RepID=UPI0014076F13|nr:class I SAM-dependent methyltransferase [Sphingobacterium chungjuense]